MQILHSFLLNYHYIFGALILLLFLLLLTDFTCFFFLFLFLLSSSSLIKLSLCACIISSYISTFLARVLNILCVGYVRSSNIFFIFLSIRLFFSSSYINNSFVALF